MICVSISFKFVIFIRLVFKTFYKNQYKILGCIPNNYVNFIVSQRFNSVEILDLTVN